MTTPDTQWELRRAYEEPSADDGVRVLVDRLWPRGLAKDVAQIDRHAIEVSPSSELRRWYGHDPQRYEEFARRYEAELDESGADEALARDYADEPVVTLLVGARDVAMSEGPILLARLREKGK